MLGAIRWPVINVVEYLRGSQSIIGNRFLRGEGMNTMDIIKAREKYLDPLYRRMDIDAKKLDWTNRFQLMALDKPDIPLDNVVNVTMNYDATYLNDLATL